MLLLGRGRMLERRLTYYPEDCDSYTRSQTSQNFILAAKRTVYYMPVYVCLDVQRTWPVTRRVMWSEVFPICHISYQLAGVKHLLRNIRGVSS